MTTVPRMRLTHAFRRTALPLASYYAVTLAVPIAHGAAQSGAFVEHALAVLAVPPVAIMLTCTVYTIVQALASACRARDERPQRSRRSSTSDTMNPKPGQPPDWTDRSNHWRACAVSPRRRCQLPRP